MTTETSSLKQRRTIPTLREPLSPKRKWQTITIATLMLVPGYWSLMAGIVTAASGNQASGIAPGTGLALGLAIVPFVFIVLAVMSEQPRWPTAVLKAMGLAVLIGVPVSAVAADAVTGIVAGVGAGGIAAIRMDDGHSWKARALAVAFAAAYTLVLVRVASVLALLPAPIFPFTAIGVADHISERRQSREPAGG